MAPRLSSTAIRRRRSRRHRATSSCSCAMARPSAAAHSSFYDEHTAELKRVWTRRDLRRQGLARKVIVRLEELALAQGYSRIFLTTGFRQPEAAGLYLNNGYSALFDTNLPHALYRHLPFVKHIDSTATRPSCAKSTGRRPSALRRRAKRKPGHDDHSRSCGGKSACHRNRQKGRTARTTASCRRDIHCARSARFWHWP